MQCVIIGGGLSIKEGQKLGLSEHLVNKFVIGTNRSYKWFKSDIQTYVDHDFYNEKYDDLSLLNCVVGQYHRDIKIVASNTHLLRCNGTYYRDVTLGCYKASLVGLFSLSLAIHLIDEETIFLLGFDNGTVTDERDSNDRWLTHFYQEDETEHHRGIGKTSYYAGNRGDKDFGVYKDETKVKIYNVSPKSNIEVFEKIDYPRFFDLIKDSELTPEYWAGIEEQISALHYTKLN